MSEQEPTRPDHVHRFVLVDTTRWADGDVVHNFECACGATTRKYELS